MNSGSKKNSDLNNIRPLIFWDGFPPCGLLIKKVAEIFGNKLIVIGTKAKVPFEKLEEELGHKIVWLNNPNEIWSGKEKYDDRNFIIHTGWSYRGWLRFDRYMKRKNGAKVIATVDNRYKGNLRQILGAIWFRVWLRKHFDAVLVPGQSAYKLMRFLGMPSNRIYYGYYGAYEELYYPGMLISQRPNEFLFIGQLNKRKGVDVLIEAYRQYKKEDGNWNLRIIGKGPLEALCCGEGIIYEGFKQAEDCASRMRTARCLILVSRDDHWGTVVCEAAACGALLITTKYVGAAADIVRQKVNGEVINKVAIEPLKEAMFNIESMDEESQQIGSDISIGIAKGYTTDTYLSTFKRVINDLY